VAAGVRRPCGSCAALPIIIWTARASPNARVIPMITAVRMPGMAEGTSTWTMVCHRVQPRPYDPSRYESGTAAMASVASEVTVGRIMNASTMELDRMP